MKYFRKLIAIFFVCISVFVITAKSDYEYLLGKYKPFEGLKAKREAAERKMHELEERLAEKERILAEKKAEHIKFINAYLMKIPNQSYSVMRTEVTQKQWQTVMGPNPSRFKGDDLPVEYVSWIDAVEFCNALSEKQGLEKCYSNGRWAYYDKKKKKDVTEEDYNKDQKKKYSKRQIVKYYVIDCNFNADGYRLPTVEEWQYAARGGQDYKYSGSDNLDEVGWYKENSEEKTHPVAQKAPNDYGLYDMSGNVMEWCWDSDDDGVCRYLFGSGRYICNGSWEDSAGQCEVGRSYSNGDSLTSSDLGFRIVRTISK